MTVDGGRHDTSLEESRWRPTVFCTHTRRWEYIRELLLAMSLTTPLNHPPLGKRGWYRSQRSGTSKKGDVENPRRAFTQRRNLIPAAKNRARSFRIYGVFRTNMRSGVAVCNTRLCGGFPVVSSVRISRLKGPARRIEHKITPTVERHAENGPQEGADPGLLEKREVAL